MLGPNGAGKTTLFNVIAGDICTRPSGTVVINGVDCTPAPSRLRPASGCRGPIRRPGCSAGLTVEDNLHLARIGKARPPPVDVAGNVARRRAMPRPGRSRRGACGSRDHLDTVVGDLSHGQQRQLEIGMASSPTPD